MRRQLEAGSKPAPERKPKTEPERKSTTTPERNRRLLDPDLMTWSIFQEFTEKQGVANGVEKVWYRLPSENISVARCIYKDKDNEIRKMCLEVAEVGEVYVYIEHGVSQPIMGNASDIEAHLAGGDDAILNFLYGGCESQRRRVTGVYLRREKHSMRNRPRGKKKSSPSCSSFSSSSSYSSLTSRNRKQSVVTN
ncbi:hypothetical protein DY000_02005413 [Brassica cretica]|uniref:Uncharacterized protein n=1 Tax=Brassica cretica TaxID=69181 RepID=A0ABQ7BTR7_BRACR|nr:hypothetical protein DY000_02005413 [Brassica cretica]